MKIKQIELYNFGSYEDKVTFDLTSNDPDQRIVIIGGKNGAGKTTLFTAMQIGLYGNFSFGYKTVGRHYLKEVYNLVNNRARLQSEESSYVRICFEHAGNREKSTYELVRRWTWETGNIEEMLSVTQDGVEMDQDEISNFQTYLVHLIPPDMLKLYFFDGEKIADYFLSESKINIRDALMVLSGNDTFDILHNNVKRVLNSSKSQDSDASSAYLTLQAEANELQEHLIALQATKDQLSEELDSDTSSLEQLKAQYAARGGLTLEQWSGLQNELKGEEEKRERINWQRKAIATDILPFIIVKDLVSQVAPQIKSEDEFIAHTVLSEKLSSPTFTGAFLKAMNGIGIKSHDKIAYVMSAVSSALINGNWEGYVPLLSLSDDEKIQVHAVLNRVSGFDSQSLSKYQKRLDKSLQRSKEIRNQIQNGDIEHMEDYIKETSELESKLQILDAKIQQISDEILRNEEELRIKNQQVSSARKQLESQLKKASVAALSGRVMLLLEDLQSNIYSMLIKKVETDLKYKLRQLLRKNAFFDDIQIDSDFNVHIMRNQAVSVSDMIDVVKKGGQPALRRNIGDVAFSQLLIGEDSMSNAYLIRHLKDITEEFVELPLEIDKERMSSGEKQIFVMALYWAIMQQSENDLPFIIDTPFARIDTEHRANITRHFFLDLVGQLFVLSTNEELTGEHLDVMNDQISHVYMLEYGDDKRTYVYQNQYFEV